MISARVSDRDASCVSRPDSARLRWPCPLGRSGAVRLIAIVALLVTVLVPASAQPATAAPAASFEWGACPVEVPADSVDRVRCGTLTVPEDRRPGSTSERVVKLPVAVIASRSATPQPDPLVFPTSGGPGGGSLSALETFLYWAEWASAEREIILVEQRGDKLSTPSLDCPELDIAHDTVDGRLSIANRLDHLTKCRDRLAADGVNLSAYTSSNSAADLADLRTALGYDEWNLYGVSYGARLALTTMRDQPAGLRAVVLDGVYPPNDNRHEVTPAGYLGSVRKLLAACAADAHCNAAYPGLEQSLLDLLKRADETPVELTIDGPDGAPLRVEIADNDISDGLFNALYDSDLIRVLPYVLDQLARGNDAAALPLAQRQIDNRDWFAEGLQQSVDCAEELPFNDEARIRAAYQTEPLATHLGFPDDLWSWCEVWDVAALGTIENRPVRSDIPTLLTSGGYDPVTPPARARTAAKELSRAYLFDFPNVGHGSVWQNWHDPCPAAIASQFLHDPTREPDASCIADAPASTFLTTDDIIATPAVYLLDRQVIRTGDPAQLALLASVAAVFVLTLVLGTIALIRRRAASVGGTVTAMAVAALHLAFAGGFYWVLNNADQLILGFGLPASARPLAILPALAAGATGVLVWQLVRSWLRTHRTPWGLLAVAAASAVFLGWLLSRGLVVW